MRKNPSGATMGILRTESCHFNFDRDILLAIFFLMQLRLVINLPVIVKNVFIEFKDNVDQFIDRNV